jgi:hypothetical protein
VPVTEPENQASCLSRACSSRTLSPVEPCLYSAGPARSTLCRSSFVGVFVRFVSWAQVAGSTWPVFFRSRLAWKPSTAFTVLDPYVPVIEPAYQSSWRSRTWRSRTFSPLAPFATTRLDSDLLEGLAADFAAFLAAVFLAAAFVVVGLAVADASVSA